MSLAIVIMQHGIKATILEYDNDATAARREDHAHHHYLSIFEQLSAIRLPHAMI